MGGKEKRRGEVWSVQGTVWYDKGSGPDGRVEERRRPLRDGKF